MSQEGFRLLQRQCINSGLCYECGLCAAVCPEQAIDIKQYDWGRNPELTGKCSDGHCTRCYDVCAAEIVPIAAMEKHFFGRNRRTDNYEKPAEYAALSVPDALPIPNSAKSAFQVVWQQPL